VSSGGSVTICMVVDGVSRRGWGASGEMVVGAVLLDSPPAVIGGVVASAASSPQERSTVNLGSAVTVSPAAGDWSQTCQFDSTTTPNVPPPRTSTSSSNPARSMSLNATSSVSPTTSGMTVALSTVALSTVARSPWSDAQPTTPTTSANPTARRSPPATRPERRDFDGSRGSFGLGISRFVIALSIGHNCGGVQGLSTLEPSRRLADLARAQQPRPRWWWNWLTRISAHRWQRVSFDLGRGRGQGSLDAPRRGVRTRPGVERRRYRMPRPASGWLPRSARALTPLPENERQVSPRAVSPRC
jgi:hypothetical protein